MNIENLFVSVLAHDKLDVDNQEISKFCYHMSALDSGRKVSNEGGYQSNIFDMSQTPELQRLHEQIIKRVNSLHDYMGFKKTLHKVVDQCWININPPGTYNSMHTHQGGVFTGVYYVQVPENSGDLQIISPISPFDFVMRDEFIETPNQFNSSNVILQPKEGYLYLFPCWLAHQVKMNLSQDSRISIAFDVKLV